MSDAKSRSESAHLDRAALEAIRALQNDAAPDLLLQVVRLYFDSAPVLLERLRTALIAGDHEAIGIAAHSLKSSSANLGATVLADMCKELESAARRGALSSALPDADAIEREYNAVRQALAAELKESAA